MIKNLGTETQNKKSMNLDVMSIKEIITLMNEEDLKVQKAISKELGSLEKVIEKVVECLNKNGRLIMFGAGTSGRLAILDAVECRPTFGTTDEVIGLIAGGEKAFVKAVENAEDSEKLAVNELKEIKLQENDIIIGIAASGRTPYVIGGLKYGKEIGCMTVAIACNKNAVISNYAELSVEVDCGPEILTGSTRLKSGTAQKLMLNMITTTSMIRIGKVYKNLMVDMIPTNAKLVERNVNMIVAATECTEEIARKSLNDANNVTKVAIVMILNGCSNEKAKAILLKNKNFIRKDL